MKQKTKSLIGPVSGNSASASPDNAERINVNTVAGADAVIRRFPTRLHARCPQCHHHGIVKVFLDVPPKLKCSRCGSADAIVVTRDRTRVWSMRRWGKR